MKYFCVFLFVWLGACWWGTKFAPSGHGTFFGLINSFVHVIMYSYYLLASMGPEYQKYLWWKKHLTSIQMIQFIIVFLHNFQVLVSPDCDYPRGLVYVMLFNATMFLVLFSNFYFQVNIVLSLLFPRLAATLLQLPRWPIFQRM